MNLSASLYKCFSLLANHVNDRHLNFWWQLRLLRRHKSKWSIVQGLHHVPNPRCRRTAFNIRETHIDVRAASLGNLNRTFRVIDPTALSFALQQTLYKFLLNKLRLSPAIFDVRRQFDLSQFECVVFWCHRLDFNFYCGFGNRYAHVQPLLDVVLTALALGPVRPFLIRIQAY